MMNAAQEQKYIAEWKKLHTAKVLIDYKIAQIACEIRNTFPAGRLGDEQLAEWALNKLQLLGKASGALILWARAWQAVGDEKRWLAIGGYQSARILVPLNRKRQTKLLTQAMEMFQQRRRPLNPSLMRSMAVKLGFIPQLDPKPLNDFNKLCKLSAFINKLYTSNTGLPQMPIDVKDIVESIIRPTKLKVAA